MGILGELDRLQLINRTMPSVLMKTIGEEIDTFDVMRAVAVDVHDFYKASPGGIPNTQAFSQNQFFNELDLDRTQGCIRNAENAYSLDGGLAVLYGNIAEDGCIVKTLAWMNPFWFFRAKRKFLKAKKMR